MEIVETVGWILVGVLGFIDGHLGVTIAFLGLGGLVRIGGCNS